MAERRAINLGTNFPIGLCSECCKRMASGASYSAIPLQQGRTIVHAYCEHAQAGAALVLREDWPARWSITMPIDILDWQELVKMKAATLAAYLEQPAGLPTADLAKERVLQ